MTNNKVEKSDFRVNFEALVVRFADYYDKICMYSTLAFIASAFIACFLNSPWTMVIILLVEFIVIFGSFTLDELATELLDEVDE